MGTDLNWCSTPLKTSPTTTTQLQHISKASQSYARVGNDDETVKELQESLSELALENEELKFELAQLRQHCHELEGENQQLHQTVQDQRDIQAKMKKQLYTVTRTVYVIYERFKSLKSRYYEDQFAGAPIGVKDDVVVGCADGLTSERDIAAPSCSRRQFQSYEQPQ